MIVYKAVFEIGNRCESAIAIFSCLKIIYPIGKWVTKKCFACKTLKAAKDFRDTQFFNTNYMRIYKAETKNCIPLKNCFTHNEIDVYIQRLLGTSKIKDYAKLLNKKGSLKTPKGTILCSGIKLLEKIA